MFNLVGISVLKLNISYNTTFIIPSVKTNNTIFANYNATVNYNKNLTLFRSLADKPKLDNIDPKDTIFAKILSKTIPAKIVHEDDLSIAFHDVNPQAPTHILIIPRKPIGGIAEITEVDKSLIGHLYWVASQIAHKLGIANDGYRLVINQGINGQQSVKWLHIHLIGGRKMTWPPG